MANLPELNSDGASINFVTAEIPEFRSTMMDAFSGIQKSLPTTESFTKAFSTMIEKNPFGSAIEPLRETVTDLKKTLNNTFQDLRNVLKDLPMDFSEMMKQSIPEAPEKQKENTYEQQIEKEDKETFYGELKQIVASPLDYMKSFMKEMQESNQGLLSIFAPKKEKQEGGALERLAEEEKIDREEKTNYYLKEILGVLNKTSGGNNDEGGGGIFSKLMSKFGFKGLGGLIPKLLGGASIVGVLGSVGLGALVVGALGKAVFDGFMGWVNAKEWGVSKMAGVLGGFLGGNAKGGVLNAVMNAGKFALMGFKLGSIFGPIGAFAGLLGGAAIGGILGWFGGEKVAKSIDNVGNWLSEKWNTALEFIKTNWNTYIAEPWDKYIATPLQELGEKITTAWQNKEELLRQGWETYVIKPIDDYIITPIKTLGAEISKKWDEGIGNLKNLWTKYVTDPLEENIIQPVRDLAKWWEELKFEFPSTKPIEDFFDDLTDFFGKFTGLTSVYALYDFLTGKNRAIEMADDSRYTSNSIDVGNLGREFSSSEETNAKNKLSNQIKNREDFRDSAYEEKYQDGKLIKDKNGNQKYAVGYGFNSLPADRNFTKESLLSNANGSIQLTPTRADDTITKEQADIFLEYLLNENRKDVDVKLGDITETLDPTRRNALYEMAYQMGLGKETKLDDGTIQRTGLLGFKNMLNSLRELQKADTDEERQKILSDVARHARDSDWYKKQTTGRATKIIHELVTGETFDAKKHDEKQIQPTTGIEDLTKSKDDYSVDKLKELIESGKKYYNIQYLPNFMGIAPGRFEGAKAGGYIAKNPSVILTGEYGGAGENPEVTIQMNALENRILATTRKLFDQANQKDMELLTTTYENRLKKAMSNAQQSETRVRQKEMVEQRMVQLQMPVTTSNIDNKTINNVSQPIVMQHSAKNERNYFRMA